MTFYLIGLRSEHYTCGKLAREYPEVFTPYYKRFRRRIKDDDLIIRYGRKKYRSLDKYRYAQVLNKCAALRTCTHKDTALKRFAYHGLNIPQIIYLRDEVKRLIENGSWLLGRKTYHFQGRDIQIIKTLDDLERDYSSDYWVYGLDVQKEFRVHVLGNRVYRISKKLPRNEDAHPIIHNFKNNWRFVDSWTSETTRETELLSNTGLIAVKSLGLDFGSVDIVIADNKPYVLEVNTETGLDERGRKLFVDALIHYHNKRW